MIDNQNSSTIKDRFLALIELFANGKKSKFATSISSKPSSINNIVNEPYSEPSFGILNKIILTYPHINSLWLLTGNGEMFLNNETTQIKNTENLQNTNTTDGNGNTTNISSVNNKKNEGIINAPLTVGDASVASLENQVSTLSEQLAFAQAQLLAKDSQIQGLLRLLENKV